MMTLRKEKETRKKMRKMRKKKKKKKKILYQEIVFCVENTVKEEYDEMIDPNWKKDRNDVYVWRHETSRPEMCFYLIRECFLLIEGTNTKNTKRRVRQVVTSVD